MGHLFHRSSDSLALHETALVLSVCLLAVVEYLWSCFPEVKCLCLSYYRLNLHYWKCLGPEVLQISGLFRFWNTFIHVMCIYGGAASPYEAHFCFIHTKPEKSLLTALLMCLSFAHDLLQAARCGIFYFCCHIDVQKLLNLGAFWSFGLHRTVLSL